MNLPKENIKKCIELTVSNLARKGIVVEINNISLNDRKTLQLYSDGNIEHVFNTGQRDAEYLKRIKKLKFEDLVNITVLTMPGKEQLIERYIASRNKLKSVVYLHPIIKPILNHTQGLLLFYEQYIEIFMRFGSFSYGEAMLLMNQFCNGIIEIKFIEKAKEKHGFSERTMSNLIKLLYESFILVPRLYHITEFTLLSYQTAYLKTHYPEEYLKARKKYFPKEYVLRDNNEVFGNI